MEKLPDLSKIKELRKKLNISQKELAEELSKIEELNVPQSTISRIERGTIDPPYTKFKRIFEYLISKRKEKEESIKIAEDFMTQNIKSINSSSTIREAVNLMNENEISQLPIIENNQNIGSITSKKIPQ